LKTVSAKRAKGTEAQKGRRHNKGVTPTLRAPA
jgi:hypothetical protein